MHTANTSACLFVLHAYESSTQKQTPSMYTVSRYYVPTTEHTSLYFATTAMNDATKDKSEAV
jgi:hypothetical protein